jgi:hypothetical protein
VSPASAALDTVVLRYFLLADRTELLLNLVGSPLGVSRVVYDPEEGDIPPAAMSEMTRAIYDQRRRAGDIFQPDDVRAAANKAMQRLHAIHSLNGIGHIEILDMADDERVTFASLTSPRGAAAADLMFPLAAGEAATIAISIGRGLVCATDDSDGLHALEVLAPGHPYERIRKLLRRAASDGLINQTTANEIHSDMRRAGFWDRGTPFPS